MVKKYLIKKAEDLLPLQKKWEKLEKGKEMTFFQSYSWNVLLIKHFLMDRYNRAFAELVVYEGDRVILPLIVQRHSINIRWIGREKGVYFLGTGSYSDYMNFVYDKVELRDIFDLVDMTTTDYKSIPIHFRNMSENLTSYSLLKQWGFVAHESEVAVAVDVTEHDEDYNVLLSKSTRQNLRTALNRMNRDGRKYELDVSEGVLDKNLADRLMKIHFARVLEINTDQSNVRRKIAGRIRNMRLKKTELENSIINEAMVTLKQSVLVLSKIDGEIAGYLYGFKDRDKVRIVQNCVVDDYKFYSPMFRGTYDFILEQIKTRAFSCVDFTRGGESYKYKLGGIETKLYSLDMPPE